MPDGFVLTIERPRPNDIVYYTTDGTDPVGFDGELRPGAVRASETESLVLTESTKIRSRVQRVSLFNPAEDWGALLETLYYVDSVRPSTDELVISAIHYRPSAPMEDELRAGFTSRSDFEYLAIENRSEKKLILDGVRIAGGIQFEFPELTELGSRERALLVNNLKAFEARYGGHDAVIGVFDGNLSNGGERLALLDVDGDPLVEFSYNDTTPWPEAADGEGQALVFNAGAEATLQADPSQWTARPSVVGLSVGAEPSRDLLGDLKLRLVKDAEGRLILTWNSKLDVVYQVQGSGDLEVWVENDLPTLPGTGDPLTADVVPGDYAYLRLSIAEQ